jgi:hypothetical protein
LEEDVAVAEGDVAVGAEADVAQAAASPITADISAAATIRRLFLFDSNRRTLARPSASQAFVARTDSEAELKPGFVSGRVSSAATASRLCPPERPSPASADGLLMSMPQRLPGLGGDVAVRGDVCVLLQSNDVAQEGKRSSSARG